MPKQENLKINFVYRILYEILTLVTPFITTPYVSRVLGAEGIGIYSYTASIASYFMLVAALGTASYGQREIAQHRDSKKEVSKLFWEIESLSLLTSCLALIVWVFVILFNVDYRYYYLALTPNLIATALDISWFFSGLEKVKYIVIRNTACKLVGIALIFLLVKDKNDLVIYILLNTVIQMLGNLSMWSYLPKLVEKVELKSLRLKKHFQQTVVYFIPTIATSIYTVLDKTMIGLITTNAAQNGYYEQATKIVNMLKSVTYTALNSVMGARISYLFAKKNYTEIKLRLQKSLDFSFAIGFGCVFGLIGVSKRFVPIFFGDGYEPVIYMIYLMAPLILITAVSTVLGSQYYTPSGRRKDSTKFLIVGSIVNLFLNAILISRFGAYGATVASLAAEAVISVLYVINSRGYMTFWKIGRLCSKKAIAACVMLAVVLLEDTMLPFKDATVLVVEVFSGAIIYLCVLLLEKDGIVREMTGTTLKKLKVVHK